MAEINKSLAFWKSFPIFEEFPKELIDEVTGLAQWRRWAAGTVIFQRGDEGNYMIMVTGGRIKVSLFTTHGKELSLRHFEAGSLIGEMSVLDGEPRSADAAAAIASEGYVIGKKEFRAFMARHSAAADAVVNFLCKRLRETNQTLETIALYNLDARAPPDPWRGIAGYCEPRSRAQPGGSRRHPRRIAAAHQPGDPRTRGRRRHQAARQHHRLQHPPAGEIRRSG
jgi:CRP-like cAMP-binding protein